MKVVFQQKWMILVNMFNRYRMDYGEYERRVE